MLGPVTTLQNVAVISSMQKTPVVGAWRGWGAWGIWGTTDPPPWLPDGNWPFDIASCAAAGGADDTRKKSRALTDTATDPRLFISCSFSLPRPRHAEHLSRSAGQPNHARVCSALVW